MEVDGFESRKLKKPRNVHIELSEKKRKRRATELLESSLPTKKPPTKSQSAAEYVTLDDSVDASPFYQQTHSLYLPLAPISQRHAIPGLCADHLSPLILVYYPPFHGVIVSYTNLQCSTSPHGTIVEDGRRKAYARSINEYAASFVWLTADFLIFKPQKGDTIDGHIILQNESSIGLVCWNFFNASIKRSRLPKSWKWIVNSSNISRSNRVEDATSSAAIGKKSYGTSGATEGYFEDGDGHKVGGLIRFEVVHVETSRSADRETSFVGIEGSVLDDGGEDHMEDQNTAKMQGSGRKGDVTTCRQGRTMSGALTNGDDIEMILPP